MAMGFNQDKTEWILDKAIASVPWLFLCRKKIEMSFKSLDTLNDFCEHFLILSLLNMF